MAFSVEQPCACSMVSSAALAQHTRCDARPSRCEGASGLEHLMGSRTFKADQRAAEMPGTGVGLWASGSI